MKCKRTFLMILSLSLCIVPFIFYGRGYWYPYYLKVKGKQTVAEVIAHIEPVVQETLKQRFKHVSAHFPPKEIALLAVKDQKKLEVWSKQQDDWLLIHAYQIQAASGVLGPKLKEGDRQVPEGVYKITGLNPNSSYHLSMKINYPNKFDLKWAAKEGRDYPGTNIFIHGKAASIGCLAMGDKVIEELFYLVNKVGMKSVTVIISPSDPRIKSLSAQFASPEWVKILYRNIESKFLEITD